MNMAESKNTAGLSADLKDALYMALRDDNTVPGTSDILHHEDEMTERFGSPRPAGYMSEECIWELSKDDADAIRSL